jgi:hypothetical protein
LRKQKGGGGLGTLSWSHYTKYDAVAALEVA